jgi:ABC-type glycerol-3-phosphate transport system substrate-binding protein
LADKKVALHLITLVFLLLAACTPVNSTLPAASQQASATSTPSPTPIPASTLGVDAADLKGVIIKAWHPWFGSEASLFETQVADFNSTNEWGITVLTMSQLNYSELFINVSASLAAPDKPDLVIGLPEHALVWDGQSGVVDLAPYVNDPLWGMSAADVADFPAVFWEQDQVGEKRLAMPAQRTTRLMAYNLTWARELGFEEPPITSDEFQKQACAANTSFRSNADERDDAFGGWLVDTDPITAMSWMLAFGGGPAEGEGFRFLKPENVEAFRFVKTIYEAGCAFRLNETTPVDAFTARRALFITMGLEDVSALSRAFLTASNNDEWTLLPFPGNVEGSMAVYGSSYIVLPTNDAQQLATWLFVRWLLSPQNQARWVSATGMFPLRTSTLDLVADYATAHPQWVGAVKLLPTAQGTPRLATWRKIRLVLGDGFDFIFRVDTPVGQVASILADMDKAVQDLVP